MSSWFERGQRISAGQLNDLAGRASEANLRAASWSAYNNGDALVTRSPRRDSSLASSSLNGGNASGWPKVATVQQVAGTTVRVKIGAGGANETLTVYILNSTGQTRLERGQTILIHALQMKALAGAVEQPAS